MFSPNTDDRYSRMSLDLNPSKGPSRFSMRRKASWILLLLSVFALGANAAIEDQDGGDSMDAQSAAPSEEQHEEKSGEGERKIAKLIPDQKAYSGAPDTVINLGAMFAGSEIAQEGKQLTFSIKRNTKSKYVEAVIEEQALILEWKKIGKTEIIVRATNASGDFIDSKLEASLWQADYWKLAMTVIGGLGIFLFGMKSMSEGLQAVAGNGLRKMIAMVTNNRLMATVVGVLATMVVQSSSITTVMVVGFVNSGFMTLSQAIGVIMGANIGTTITGWILVLKIGKYGLPILGLCVFIYLFVKNERIRFLALFGMGLGMVFLGLEIMKDGFTMVKNLPEFEAWFHTFSADTYFGVLKCAAVGCILTFIVQSSSATLGITIGLAQIGVIPFETAAALVMGENVGTTITAWLASFGTTTNAKRAAYFHVVFNLVGVAWITAIFSWYLPIVEYVASYDSGDDPTKAIAMAHTCFNIANTLLFLPLAGIMAVYLQKFIPDRAVKEKPHLTSLDIRMLETPVIGIEQSRVEILRMADGCKKMMDWLRELMTQDEPDRDAVQKVFHREEVLDTIQDEVVAFMTHLLSGNVPHTIVEEGRRQLRMTDEYESISDYITSILKFNLKLRDQGHRFDEKHLNDLLELHDMVDDYLKLVSEGHEFRQPEVITKANSRGAEITLQVKKLRDRHLEDLTEARMEPYINVAYTSTLNSYRRVRDHAKNVAEALAGEK